MEGITIDQFNAAFGEFRIPLEQQTSLLSKIERVVTEKLDKFSDRITSVKTAINDLTTIAAAAADQQTDAINVVIAGQNEQIEYAERLQKTVQDGLKVISSSFVSKDTPQKETDRKNDPLLRQPSKAEKQSIKGILGVDTKIGALLKEIQGLRKDEDSRSKGTVLGALGGVFGFLGPLLTVVGGFAALSYAAMAYGPTRQFLEGVQKDGLGVTLKNLAGKLSIDKIKNFLRNMPVVGRLFDVYDAFKSFIKGDWKMGLKHLAFALPFGEDLIYILGGTSKQQFLAPGGVQAFEKGFSFEDAWKRLKEVVTTGFNNIFNPIVETYNHLKEALGLFGEGTEMGIKKGWLVLSQYFPMLAPVADFFTGLTENVFEGKLGQEARETAPDGTSINVGDIINTAFKNIKKSISDLFHSVLRVFMTTGKVLNAIADVFSGDTGKQAAALNYLDDAASPVAGMLRPIAGIMATIKDAGIKEGDSPAMQATKITGALTKGAFGYGSQAGGKSATYAQEISDLTEQINKAPEGADKDKQKRALEYLQTKKKALDLQHEISAKESSFSEGDTVLMAQKTSVDQLTQQLKELQQGPNVDKERIESTKRDLESAKDALAKRRAEIGLPKMEQELKETNEQITRLQAAKAEADRITEARMFGEDIEQNKKQTALQTDTKYPNLEKTRRQAFNINTTPESLVSLTPQPTVFSDTMGDMNDTLDDHSTYLKDIAIEARKQTTGIKDLIETINKNLSNASSSINVVNASSWSLNTQQSTSRDTRNSFSNRSYGQ
jgi:hypothetical protein